MEELNVGEMLVDIIGCDCKLCTFIKQLDLSNLMNTTPAEFFVNVPEETEKDK